MTSHDFIAAEADNVDRIVLYREGLFWKAYERSAFAVCSQVRPFKPTKKSLKTLGGGELVSIGFPTVSESAVLGALERIAEEPMRLVLATPRPIVVREFEAWKASLPLKAPGPTRSAVRAARILSGGLPGGSPEVPCVAPSGVASETQTGLSPGALSGLSPEARSGVLSGASSGLSPEVRNGFPAGLSPEVRYGVQSGVSAGVTSEVRYGVQPGGFCGARPGTLSEGMPAAPSDLSSVAAAGVPGNYAGADFTLTAACRVAESLRCFNLAEKTPMECMMYISELKKILVNP